MIELKEAVKAAFQATANVFGDDVKAEDLRLEEVELAEDHSRWLITVSFMRRAANLSDSRVPGVPAPEIFRPTLYNREYKQVVLDASTGEVQAIRIRNLAI